MIEFHTFFENSSPATAGTMVQWKANFELKLLERKNELKQKVVQYCDVLVAQQNAKKRFNEMQKLRQNALTVS